MLVAWRTATQRAVRALAALAPQGAHWKRSLGPRQTYGLSIHISAKLPGSRGLVAAASLLDGLLPFTLQPLDALEHSCCRVPRPGATSSPSSSPSKARPSPCLLRVVPAGSGLLTPPKHREVLR